ncbi:hypothetical protein BEP19_08000 [Ammoniphilus oxalaticus]|uniref:Uncharacterized protein n=1 Tax=Ammoniphilus oxalaticus TaxID=66863 RepID=A0A419SK54_9BACL|nr:hypothetical protein [Ammoniphilus oxalaticus]RKD24330.1 hypothetical protein BEP19_08000 [Ammoniphilus oxalaticus]
MGQQREWMIVLQCPCSPYDNIIITDQVMQDGLVMVCSQCARPLVILGSDGHLYLIGDVIIEHAVGNDDPDE